MRRYHFLLPLISEIISRIFRDNIIHYQVLNSNDTREGGEREKINKQTGGELTIMNFGFSDVART